MATELAEDEKPQENTISTSELRPNFDLTINANTSDFAEKSSLNSEGIYKHGFSIDDLYKFSLKFYKKEKENLVLTYDDKILLVALWKQVTSGKYDDSKLPEIGYFDVIGNDRKRVWQSLGDISVIEAKKQFFSILEKSCSSYESYILERRREIDEEIKRKQLEEEARILKEEEEKARVIEQERIRKEEQQRVKLALEAEKEKMIEEEKQKRLQAETQHEPEPKQIETPTLLTPQANGPNSKMLAPASLWTRPKLQEFINHVKRDASSVIVVGRGETVTIRVPTHEHGSCLFWEFATESYDVGFGVYFEWTRSTQSNNSSVKSALPTNISVQVNESDSESITTNSPATNDNMQGVNESIRPVVVNENENNIEIMEKENVDEVLPVLRRTSHEEVIVGSHLYPGRGIYLLKFDNSYSLLRSKTLYYRVYYTK